MDCRPVSAKVQPQVSIRREKDPHPIRLSLPETQIMHRQECETFLNAWNISLLFVHLALLACSTALPISPH
jgi:hypothetical protein